MKRLLLATVLVAGVAACEPEYAETAGGAAAVGADDHAHDAAEGAAEPAEHAEVVGGADPTAISGRVPGDTASIHHPSADGNSGRPADGRGHYGERPPLPGAAAGAADSAGTGTTGIGTTGATANGSGGTRAAGAAADSQSAPADSQRAPR